MSVSRRKQQQREREEDEEGKIEIWREIGR
jgi:hypothetical protein